MSLTSLRSLCLGLLAAFVTTNAGFAADAGKMAFERVHLVDGRGGPVQAEMTVIVEGGRFTLVKPAALVTAADLAGAQRIDSRGRYLMPGLVDMHVHLDGGVVVTAEGLRQAGNDRARGAAALASYLYAGVTSIYDAGNVPDYIFGLRDDERAGRIAAPRIFATGGIVTYPGSHGSGPGSVDIDAWPAGRERLDALLARRPDVVKLTLEERGWGARPMIPALPDDLLRSLIRRINEAGFRTTVHVSSELRATQAIFAAADTLAHPVIQGPASEQYFRLLAAKGTPVVTTLTIGENYSRLVEHPEYLDEPLYRKSLSAEQIRTLRSSTRDEWRESLWTHWMKLMTPVAMKNLRKLHESGGVLVLGTDQTLGPAVHRELELLQQAGIPPLALTRIATLNGAIFLGRAEQAGSIEVGKEADALLLSKDPTKDIRNAREIEQVMKAGKLIDRESLPLAGR
ncbi:MAG: amidohydrolase family protein [Sinobacteraceae bacterium]|nr:amidohydrolase family protein [Nevskiaceae bacterium]